MKVICVWNSEHSDSPESLGTTEQTKYSYSTATMIFGIRICVSKVGATW
jgi:hypothetical protein